MTTHAGVAGNSGQERGEDHADTDTSTTETDGSGTHTQVLGDLDHSGSDLGGEGAASLLGHHVAGGGREDGGGLLTLDGIEGSVTGDSWTDV